MTELQDKRVSWPELEEGASQIEVASSTRSVQCVMSTR
jgi:hypothetical protein